MASLGLLANYGDSSDDNSDDDNPNQELDVQKKTNESHEAVDFFGVNENSESESEDENDIPNEGINEEIKTPPVNKLPPPDLSSFERTSSRNSVFGNPFQEAEEAKKTVLEKHVKMTNFVPEEKGNKNKKKKQVCYKFLKGNCSFGDKCRFFHSSPSGKDVTSPGNPNSKLNVVKNNPFYGSGQANVPEIIEPADDDSYMGNVKKRKRPGLNDTLVPPKKSLHNYGKQREKERPWSGHKKK